MKKEDWRLYGEQMLGIHDCYIVTRTIGSATEWEWVDKDYGFMRQHISASNRPAMVWTDKNGHAFTRTRGRVVGIDDFTRCNPLRIGKFAYNFSFADSAFSGLLIDGEKCVRDNGERVYVAYFYC